MRPRPGRKTDTRILSKPWILRWVCANLKQQLHPSAEGEALVEVIRGENFHVQVIRVEPDKGTMNVSDGTHAVSVRPAPGSFPLDANDPRRKPDDPPEPLTLKRSKLLWHLLAMLDVDVVPRVDRVPPTVELRANKWGSWGPSGRSSESAAVAKVPEVQDMLNMIASPFRPPSSPLDDQNGDVQRQLSGEQHGSPESTEDDVQRQEQQLLLDTSIATRATTLAIAAMLGPQSHRDTGSLETPLEFHNPTAESLGPATNGRGIEESPGDSDYPDPRGLESHGTRPGLGHELEQRCSVGLTPYIFSEQRGGPADLHGTTKDDVPGPLATLGLPIANIDFETQPFTESRSLQADDNEKINSALESQSVGQDGTSVGQEDRNSIVEKINNSNQDPNQGSARTEQGRGEREASHRVARERAIVEMGMNSRGETSAIPRILRETQDVTGAPHLDVQGSTEETKKTNQNAQQAWSSAGEKRTIPAQQRRLRNSKEPSEPEPVACGQLTGGRADRERDVSTQTPASTTNSDRRTRLTTCSTTVNHSDRNPVLFVRRAKQEQPKPISSNFVGDSGPRSRRESRVRVRDPIPSPRQTNIEHVIDQKAGSHLRSVDEIVAKHGSSSDEEEEIVEASGTVMNTGSEGYVPAVTDVAHPSPASQEERPTGEHYVNEERNRSVSGAPQTVTENHSGSQSGRVPVLLGTGTAPGRGLPEGSPTAKVEERADPHEKSVNEMVAKRRSSSNEEEVIVEALGVVVNDADRGDMSFTKDLRRLSAAYREKSPGDEVHANDRRTRRMSTTPKKSRSLLELVETDTATGETQPQGSLVPKAEKQVNEQPRETRKATETVRSARRLPRLAPLPDGVGTKRCLPDEDQIRDAQSPDSRPSTEAFVAAKRRRVQPMFQLDPGEVNESARRSDEIIAHIRRLNRRSEEFTQKSKCAVQ